MPNIEEEVKEYPESVTNLMFLMNLTKIVQERIKERETAQNREMDYDDPLFESLIERIEGHVSESVITSLSNHEIKDEIILQIIIELNICFW